MSARIYMQFRLCILRKGKLEAFEANIICHLRPNASVANNAASTSNIEKRASISDHGQQRL